MVIDFLHFCANLLIALTFLRMIQARTVGTEWGKVFAFFG